MIHYYDRHSGVKIKALRERTNTDIRTPSRDEPPVFVVEGRIEDVIEAKLAIEAEAEHFTRIRGYGIPQMTLAPCNVTAFIRVPQKLAGLVVGPKGATVKRIQTATVASIVSPNAGQEPVFEV